MFCSLVVVITSNFDMYRKFYFGKLMPLYSVSFNFQWTCKISPQIRTQMSILCIPSFMLGVVVFQESLNFNCLSIFAIVRKCQNYIISRKIHPYSSLKIKHLLDTQKILGRVVPIFFAISLISGIFFFFSSVITNQLIFLRYRTQSATSVWCFCMNYVHNWFMCKLQVIQKIFIA